MLRINDAKISTTVRLDLIPTGVFLRRDEDLKRLMDVAEPCLRSLSMSNQFSEISFRLVLVVLGRIIPNDGFYIGDKLQIAVPIVQTQYAAKEDETLVTIV